MSTVDVTMLGAGKLGAALVERWTAADRTVRVWNRTQSRAAELAGPQVHVATDVALAVTNVSVVASVLTDGAALRSVLVDHGAIRAMGPSTTLVDLSTVDVESSRMVANEAAKHGIGFVRCGVSGTAAVVTAGQAGLILSGPAGALDSAASLLGDLTANQVVVGDADEARIVKLAVNLLLAGTTEVLAEAMVMAEASGVDRDVLLRAIDSTVITSRFLSYKGVALRARDYEPTFTTADLRKDVTIALAEAAAADVPMQVTEAVLAQLIDACESGWAGDDFLSLVRLVQTQAGRPVDAVE